MAITRVGTPLAAAATSVTLPAHAVGDVIVISARGTAASPTTPTAGGTVPTWTSRQSGIANALGLNTATTIATATNHTSGTWTNATHITASVFRTNVTNATLSIGASSTLNNSANQSIPYPALTLTQPNGSSCVYRAGARTTATAALAATGNAGTGFLIGVSTPATPVLAAWDRFAVSGNQAANTMNLGAGTAVHRAHTLEIVETLPPPLTKVVSWRLRDDDGSEATATWKAPAGVDAAIPEGETFRLRFEFEETSGNNETNTDGYHLRVSKNGGAENDVVNSTDTPLNLRLAASVNVSDREATTRQLAAGTGSFVPGQVDKDGGGSTGVGIGPTASDFTENEWVLTTIAADVVPGDQLLIKAYNSALGTPVVLAPGVAWPIVTVGSNVSSKFIGVLDEVAVYDAALPASQALEHYRAGGAGPLYPPNYTTGPLLVSNILPATTDGALFGLRVGIAGLDAEAQFNYLIDHIADLGRSPDIVESHMDTYTFGGTDSEDHVRSIGAVPVVTLPEGPETGANQGTHSRGMYDGFYPTEIIAGDADASLNAIADRYAAKSYRIMACVCREFDLSGDMGGFIITTSQTQQDFREAWQHIVNVFQGRGATNVGWYWTPTERAGDPERANIDACYPGHEYVDWVGTTSYNHDRVGVFTHPNHDLWTEFRECFDYGFNTAFTSMCEEWSPQKPFVVAETGCLFSRDGTQNKKANWFRNIDDVAKPAMPDLRGVIYFGQAVGVEECFVDWRGYSDAQPQDNFDCGLPAQSDCLIAGCGAHGSFHQETWDGFLYWSQRPRWNVGILGGP